MFLFTLQISSETYLILRRMKQDIIINIRTFSCKEHVILIAFNETLIFSTNFRKILKYLMS